MNEELELIKHIYKDSEMASYTIERLLEDLEGKDNKIKEHAQELLNQYQEFFSKSKNILEDESEDLPKNGILSKMGAKMGIDKEVKHDNSDSSIADMLIKGMVTGKVDIDKKISCCKEDSSKKSLSLAYDFKKFQEESIEKLKEFL